MACQDPDLVRDEIIKRLKRGRRKKISEEQAARIMDNARVYNTKHYGTKYPAR